MQAPSALGSGAFRFALLMAAFFAIGSAALLVAVERSVGRYGYEAATDAVSAEMDILTGEYRALGRGALVAAIGRHEQAVRERQLRYLLRDADGRRLAGTLAEAPATEGWHRIRIIDPADPEQRGRPIPLLVLSAHLGDGALLAVGGNIADLVDLGQRLRTFTIAFGVLVSALALAGGGLVGSMFLRRLDRVNHAIGRINGGRFGERLPRIGMGREFDRLSTNLNNMLDRMEALMDGLRQVSTDIAHDLRTPLTRLRQRLERMPDGNDGATLEEQRDAALAQVDEILALFAALLRIGSLAAGARLSLAPVDLSEVIERVGQAYVPVAEDSGHLLEVVVAPAIVVVGDGALLAQAATNLVENAIRHTLAGSSIALSLAREAEDVCLTVADDGPGVPTGERDKVLRRFYRLDHSRHTPGSGLGLALVAAIAGLHEAELRLVDNHPGLRVVLRFRSDGN